MNPISNIIDRINAYRYGQTGITGLNELRNQATMFFLVVTPFVGAWMGIRVLILSEMVTEIMGALLSMASIIGWGFYCGIFWALVSKDASQYKCLPQCGNFFPDGQSTRFNMPIRKEGGITKRCDFADGSIGVEMHFLHRYLHQSPDMDFPYVFERGLVRLPSGVGNTFEFQQEGEWWHKGMIVTTSSCEHASIYWFDWVYEDDQWKPVGVLSDCMFNYNRAKKRFFDPNKFIDVHEADEYFMLYHQRRQKYEEQSRYTRTLEDAHKIALKHLGKSFKKEVDRTISAIRDGVHSISDIKEPIWKRVFKLGNIIKFVIVAGVIMVVLWRLGLLPMG